MGRENRHRHIVQKRHIGLCQFESNRIIINYCDLFYIFIVGGVFRSVIRIHNSFDGKLDIVSCKGFSIVPLDALSDMEGVGIGALIVLPTFGQTGNNLILAIMGGQSVKQQHIDLAVLIHSRIDSCVIARTINECRCAGRLFLSISLVLYIVRGCSRCATSGQAHGHDHSKKHG